MSMARIRAYGCGLRSVTPQIMSSIHRSLAYANSPVTLSVPSGRTALSPTPSRVVGVRVATGVLIEFTVPGSSQVGPGMAHIYVAVGERNDADVRKNAKSGPSGEAGQDHRPLADIEAGRCPRK